MEKEENTRSKLAFHFKMQTCESLYMPIKVEKTTERKNIKDTNSRSTDVDNVNEEFKELILQ